MDSNVLRSGPDMLIDSNVLRSCPNVLQFKSSPHTRTTPRFSFILSIRADSVAGQILKLGLPTEILTYDEKRIQRRDGTRNVAPRSVGM